MKLNGFVTIIATIMVIFSVGSQSQAASSHGSWDSNTVRIYLHQGFGQPGDWDYDAFSDAVSRFNLNPSQFNWDLWYNVSSVGNYNDRNEVWWSSSISAPAYAWWRYYADGSLREADIVFKSNYSPGWTGTAEKVHLLGFYYEDWVARAIQSTAIHELGHASGFNHECYKYNVMGSDATFMYSYKTSAYAYLGADLSNKLRNLYGNSSYSNDDISASPFKYDYCDGEYSQHKKCQMYVGGTWDELSNYGTKYGQKCYRVWGGNTYRFQYTMENNGKTYWPNVHVKYYISTNTDITSADTPIGYSNFTNFYPGDISTKSIDITIPSNLNRYTIYYLGVVVDGNYSVSEVKEKNNMMYHPIYIR